MKKLMTLMVVNNRIADEEMLSLLEKQERAFIDEDRGNHYRSIRSLLLHCVQCEMAMLIVLKGIADISLPEAAWNSGQDLHKPETNPFIAVRKNFNPADQAELFRSLREIDSLYESIIRGIGVEAFSKSMTTRGRELQFHEVLYQIMNHQIHHRGQIAQILDEIGIANDYSGAWDRFELAR